MRSTLDEFESELNELKDLVASIAPVNSVLSANHDLLVRKYVSIRRRFDYSAFVVALYASFEKFIENLVAACVRLKTRRLGYADLPTKLVKKHLSRTAELLARGRLGEGRYAGIRELDVVQNLFECLNGVTPYKLNEAAVVAHDQNLRGSEIDSLFAVVGIDQVCDRVRKADALLEWHGAGNGFANPLLEEVPTTTIEERLKDIVERRNQVAHRGSPVELLGVDEMNEALRFIEAFSKSVFAIAVGHYLQDHHAQACRLQQRPKDGPYKDGRVVVVQEAVQRLFIGQPVFVIVKATGARWGRIQSLRVDDAVVTTVEEGDGGKNGIGIGLDFKCPKESPLCALREDDDVVWNPDSAAPTESVNKFETGVNEFTLAPPV